MLTAKDFKKRSSYDKRLRQEIAHLLDSKFKHVKEGDCDIHMYLSVELLLDAARIPTDIMQEWSASSIYDQQYYDALCEPAIDIFTELGFSVQRSGPFPAKQNADEHFMFTLSW